MSMHSFNVIIGINPVFRDQIDQSGLIDTSNAQGGAELLSTSRWVGVCGGRASAPPPPRKAPSNSPDCLMFLPDLLATSLCCLCLFCISTMHQDVLHYSNAYVRDSLRSQQAMTFTALKYFSRTSRCHKIGLSSHFGSSQLGT